MSHPEAACLALWDDGTGKPPDCPEHGEKAAALRESIEEGIRQAGLEDAIAEGYDPTTGRYDPPAYDEGPRTPPRRRGW